MKNFTRSACRLFFCFSFSAALTFDTWAQSGNTPQQAAKGTELDEPAAKGDYKNIYAVVVGISKYEKKKEIDSLNYAAADARSMTRFIKSLPVKSQVVQLVDGEATKPDIDERGLDWITKLVRRGVIKDDDLIILYLSGHGGAFNDKDDAKTYFFTHESESFTDAGTSENINVIKNTIKNWIEDSHAKVLFIFDACRSTTQAGIGAAGLRNAARALQDTQGEILFAATAANEKAWEDGNIKHGVFTYYLLKGWHGWAGTAGTGSITAFDLGTYVSNRVDSSTSGRQQPIVNYNTYNRFVLAPVKLGPVKFRNIITDSLQQVNENAVEMAAAFAALNTRFNECLKTGKLVKPETACAYYYYAEMQKISKPAETESQKTELSISLYKKAQAVIKNDLNGRRDYLRPGANVKIWGKNLSMGVDLDYYSNASACLKRYIDLSRRKDLDPVVYAIKDYLDGRQLALEYTENRDSSLLIKSEKLLRASVAKNPGQSFLWQALGMSLIQHGQFAEATNCMNKTRVLAPLWSYPLVSLGVIQKQKGDLIKARQYYDSAVKINPRDISTYVNLSQIETGERSIQYLKTAYKIDPETALLPTLMGIDFYIKLNYDSALFYFTKSTKTDSLNDIPYIFSAMALSDQGKHNAALAMITRAAKNMPTSPETFNSMGMIYALLKNHDLAAAAYTKAILLNPKSATYYTNYAITLAEMSKYDDAVNAYKKAIELQPNSYALHNDLGTVYAKQKKFEEAEDEYLKSIEISPKNKEGHYNMGMHYLRQKNTDKAIQEFQTTVKTDTVFEMAYLKLGSIYQELKRTEEAMAMFKKVISLNPKSQDAHRMLGFLYAELGMYDDAVRSFKNANKVSSTPLVNKGLGLTLMQQEKYTEAVDAFKEMVRLEPDIENYNFLGKAQHLVGNDTAAIRAHEKALSLDPYKSETLFSLANIYSSQKKYRQSIDLMGKVRAKDVSGESDNQTFLGEAYLGLQDTMAAARHFRKAISLKKNTTIAISHLLTILSAQKKYTEEIVVLNQGIETDQKNEENYQSELGYVYHMLHRPKEAAEALKKSITINPGRVIPLYNLSCVYAVQKQNAEALLWLEEAIKKGYTKWDDILNDPDMAELAKTDEFKNLIAKYKK